MSGKETRVKLARQCCIPHDMVLVRRLPLSRFPQTYLSFSLVLPQRLLLLRVLVLKTVHGIVDGFLDSHWISGFTMDSWIRYGLFNSR